jgi:acyl dehydratase
VTSNLHAAAEVLSREVGRIVHEEIGSISPMAARRFAVASGERDPIFFDEDAAHAAGWSGIPVPPLLLSSTRSWQFGPDRAGLRPDGTPRIDVGFPDGHGLRALGGGQSLYFHEDIVTGVEVMVDVELTGTSVKSGRNGEMIIVELERRFSSVDGQVLLTCEETRILR